MACAAMVGAGFTPQSAEAKTHPQQTSFRLVERSAEFTPPAITGQNQAGCF